MPNSSINTYLLVTSLSVRYLDSRVVRWKSTPRTHPVITFTPELGIILIAMVKPLQFKGEKKSRKRKVPPDGDGTKKSSNDASAVPKTSEASGEDDSWVTAEAPTDIIGPIIFALPSAQPCCLACDGNGKVFASGIENMVGADLATAEPHDMRQVWVACRIAGTEKVSFKGCHGG